MKYIIDHDLHIHSQISRCSGDPAQTSERILQYAEENGFRVVCLTDHFWDETVEGASGWYAGQNYAHICTAKPLPQSDSTRFLFGCETELNRFLTLGVSEQRMASLDFIIIPTTHFHMRGYTLTEEETASPQNRARAWVRRLDSVLSRSLPFRKIGIAHLTCGLIAPTREEYLETLASLSEADMRPLFERAAHLGVGIELNADDMSFAESEADVVLRPYRIAKACGCKFYCGSDAHHPHDLARAKQIFERTVECLELKETDKFLLPDGSSV